MKKITLFGSILACFMLVFTLIVPSTAIQKLNHIEDVIILDVLIDDHNVRSKILGGQIVDMGVEIRYLEDRSIIESFTIGMFLDHYIFLDEQTITKDMILDGKNRVIFDDIYMELDIGKHTIDAYINENVHSHNFCEFKTTFTGLGTLICPLNKIDFLSNNKGKALLATIYVELDPESQQVQDILDNLHAPPCGFLTNIDITVPDPNDEDGEWFMIAPFIRTLIGDWIGIGPFFEIITPTETTIVHIKLLWGDVHYWPPGGETPEEFIIDGWVPFISWEY
jgi:hypothetical protein